MLLKMLEGRNDRRARGEESNEVSPVCIRHKLSGEQSALPTEDKAQDSTPVMTTRTFRASGSPYMETYAADALLVSSLLLAKGNAPSEADIERLDDFKERVHIADSETDINLIGSHLSSSDVQLLVELLAEGRLKKLFVGRTGLGDDAAKTIAASLAVNTTLTCLSLASNDISDEGGYAIAQALSQNTSLQSLYLFDNPLSDAAREAIRVANAERATPCEGLGLVV